MKSDSGRLLERCTALSIKDFWEGCLRKFRYHNIDAHLHVMTYLCDPVNDVWPSPKSGHMFAILLFNDQKTSNWNCSKPNCWWVESGFLKIHGSLFCQQLTLVLTPQCHTCKLTEAKWVTCSTRLSWTLVIHGDIYVLCIWFVQSIYIKWEIKRTNCV